MEIEAIKVLLEAQVKTFKTAMDIVVEQMKSRIQLAEGTITDLIKSLEYTQAETRDLQNEIMVLKRLETDNKATIDTLKLRIEELERRSNYQEDYNRRNNLRITGIQEQPGGETWEETANTVSKLMEEKLQLPPMKIERAHRTGPATTSGRRTVVARFERFGDREAVIRNARKLKGTGIFINEDLCPASQELKRSQFPLMKQAREEGKIAFFKHTKLIIKDRTSQRPGFTSGDVSTTGAGGDVTMGPRSGAVGDGRSARAGETVVGAGAGGGKGVLLPAAASASTTSSVAVTNADAAAVFSAPAGTGTTASSPDGGDSVMAAGYTAPGGSDGDLGAADGAIKKNPKNLRNRRN